MRGVLPPPPLLMISNIHGDLDGSSIEPFLRLLLAVFVDHLFPRFPGRRALHTLTVRATVGNAPELVLHLGVLQGRWLSKLRRFRYIRGLWLFPEGSLETPWAPNEGRGGCYALNFVECLWACRKMRANQMGITGCRDVLRLTNPQGSPPEFGQHRVVLRRTSMRREDWVLHTKSA